MVGCNAILGIQEFASPPAEGGADAAKDDGNVARDDGSVEPESGGDAAQSDATTMDGTADVGDGNAEATGDVSVIADADASAVDDADSSAGGDADANASNDADAMADVADAGDGSSAPMNEGGSAAPRSCAAGGDGLSNCGATAESCCTSLPITGGTYNRTYTNSGTGPSGEADPASVSSYDLDKYLVTVGRFRQFVRALWPLSLIHI